MKRDAIDLGLCAQWTAEWEDNTSKDDMVDKFVRGIDFCIEHDWPSAEVIKKEFGDVIHRHGVYVDEYVEVKDAPMVILNGKCTARIIQSNVSVGDIYIRHSSEAKVCVIGHSRSFVSVYDDAAVSVDCKEGSKCFVYLYGNGRVIHTSGDVAIRYKRS